jgi:energy-coupling factor transporter ATP-binding protein EcfA2
MLQRLHVRNFTVFNDAVFEFSSGLNVVVGANGTGKSHVLKLGYALQQAYAVAPRSVPNVYQPTQESTDVIVIATALSRLQEVFLTNGIHKLVRRIGTVKQRLSNQARIRATFGKTVLGTMDFTLDDNADPTSRFFMAPQVATVAEAAEKPVFIPAKELLSLMPDIIGLSDKYADLLDSTYTGLARALVVPLLKNPPVYAQEVLSSIGKTLHGTIESENGRFYLAPQEWGERFEIGLVAEGYRKLGTLAYLLANGSLGKDNTLYWDEPEANLNPALLREVAQLLVKLAQHGFQIILATHSLFLLKEFHILAREQNKSVRYFGLSAEPGQATEVVMRDNLELLPNIVALDAELDQSDRFQAVLDQEDAD